MASQERERLKSEIITGKLTIPGHEGAWRQRAPRSFWLDVTDLTLHSYTNISSDRVPDQSRSGERARSKRTVLRWLAGVTVVRFFRPSSGPEPGQRRADPIPAWTAVIGFTPSDREPKSQDEWFCEAWIPDEGPSVR